MIYDMRNPEGNMEKEILLQKVLKISLHNQESKIDPQSVKCMSNKNQVSAEIETTITSTKIESSNLQYPEDEQILLFSYKEEVTDKKVEIVKFIFIFNHEVYTVIFRLTVDRNSSAISIDIILCNDYKEALRYYKFFT
jgi:hypothetical protein